MFVLSLVVSSLFLLVPRKVMPSDCGISWGSAHIYAPNFKEVGGAYCFWFALRCVTLFSSPEQHSGRAIVLPPASGLALALASTNVKIFVKVFKTSLFPNLITDLIHLWYDDTYWSKILHSTITTTLGHVKVKVTDLEFSC